MKRGENGVLKILRRGMVLTVLLSLLTVSFTSHQAVAADPVANPVSLHGWDVSWQITPDDGLGLSNVKYHGTTILNDARLPGVVINYFGGTCIFYDEIGYYPPSYNASLTVDNIVLTSIPSGGFNLTGIAKVPGYDYKQSWLFYPDGRFLALLKIGGGGCFDIHTYNIRWRFDFAIGNPVEESMQYYTQDGWANVRTESVLTDPGIRDSSHSFTAWKVGGRDKSYYLAPFDSPQASTDPPKVLVVAAHPGEIEDSHAPAVVSPYIYLNGERVYRTDIAFWYLVSHTHNVHRALLFEDPILTGLVFYPSGF